MISAPGFQYVVKWVTLCIIAFLCIAIASLRSPTDSIKYQKAVVQHSSVRLINISTTDGNKSTNKLHVNPHPYSFLLLEPDACSSIDRSNGITMITVVHSAPSHFKSRDFIRQTWGDRSVYPENRVLFVLGQANSSTIQRLITKESREFNDIIQEDFQDTYRNLTYKSIGWLKYVSQYCPSVDFVLKVDDDVVVNMKQVIKFLKYHYTIGDRRTIYCLIWYNLTVQREADNRWRLTKEDYDNDNFPNYCSGSAYLLTNDIISPLYKESFHVPFFWIDDIYLTGLLVKQYNDRQIDPQSKIKHYDLSARYVLSRRLLVDQFLQHFAMFVHIPGSVNARHWYWDEMQKKGIGTPRLGIIADAAIRI